MKECGTIKTGGKGGGVSSVKEKGSGGGGGEGEGKGKWEGSGEGVASNFGNTVIYL